MNKSKELVKNTVIIFLGKACTQLISFLLLPLYTAYLTKSDYVYADLRFFILIDIKNNN